MDRMPTPLPPVKELETYLVLAAELVVRYGPAYAVFVERVERDLEFARRHDPVEKAKRILAAVGR